MENATLLEEKKTNVLQYSLFIARFYENNKIYQQSQQVFLGKITKK